MISSDFQHLGTQLLSRHVQSSSAVSGSVPTIYGDRKSYTIYILWCIHIITHNTFICSHMNKGFWGFNLSIVQFLYVNVTYMYIQYLWCWTWIFYVKYSKMLCCRVSHNVGSNYTNIENELIFANRRVYMKILGAECCSLYCCQALHNVSSNLRKNEAAQIFSYRKVFK